MAKDEVKKDPKGRKLKPGESYDEKKGRYRYAYTNANGKRTSLYSYTLTKNDPIPSGKKQKVGQSLREREEKVQNDIYNKINRQKGNITVYQLMEDYIKMRFPEVRETTRNGYRTQLKFMSTNPFGKKKINEIKPTQAEEWFDELHEKYGKNYSSLKTLLGILRPAFRMAQKDDLVQKNPFEGFSLNRKRYGGSKTREAISKADMRRFLDFLRTDSHFNCYFNGVFILFNTGLRISEFCGLTMSDIDFNEHIIHVRRQLIRIHNGSKMIYYIEPPKTDNGIRDVPMMKDVETVFHDVIEHRPKLKKEPVVFNESKTEFATGFLWFDKNENLEVAQHWQNHMRWALAKFNKIFKDPLPDITPHVCRHTFCSNCASLGMNPKTLQVIMGHSSIAITMDVYTHLETGDIKQQCMAIFNNPAYDLYSLDKPPKLVAPPTYGDDIEEGDVDPDEAPDDEDD